MQTLHSVSRNNLYYCGLPGRFQVQLRVLQYAQMDITADEYREFYQRWDSFSKKLADKLMTEIANHSNKKVGA